MTAVTAAAEAAPRLDMGRVAKTTFATIQSNLPVFGLLSMALIGIPDALVEWLVNVTKAAGDSSGSIGFTLLERLLDAVGTVVLTGSAIHITHEHLAGRRAGVGESLSVGLRNSAKVFGINVVSGIGAALGLLLFIVPGVILALRWSMSVPAGVVEGLGVAQAMDRSVQLTKGNRWAILGLFTALALGFLAVAVLFGFCAGLVEAIDPGAEAAASAAATGISDALLTLFLGVGPAVVYAELRAIREGGATGVLESVFD